MFVKLLTASGLTLAAIAGFARAETPETAAVLETCADIAAAGHGTRAGANPFYTANIIAGSHRGLPAIW
ncbi:hypothetical protein [Afifella pfennigii]|uniref:hypothetical protein n=1 Tax=Afifella pfennigii TaxID=209897 RepID=UPI00047EC08A|nr:hypothetical protein [Afifella pfennigii]